MKLVKVKDSFFDLCKANNCADELLFNEDGRPGVLLIQMTYKGKKHNFVVPLRSNISSSTPQNQYFSLPPNSKTRSGNSHGIHFIKIFPIKEKYINSYATSSVYDTLIKRIIDKNETIIIEKCKEYLKEYELGNKHPLSPDIDRILEIL